MNEHDKQVSGVEARANPAPLTGRRRFVKGAMLAMPAIITLRTGSALAQAQNSLTCIEKANERDDEDPGQSCLGLYFTPT
ncbi:MAG TPA: hypothetical protein P5102_17135 [Candidatus Competibacteraceae bacterium]|nr:hypothetical protein [Candidatus Competibacteraceae bacterium]HRZ07830.1 hypothetical protein [Candidatus Competibacteraceae bacterium]